MVMYSIKKSKRAKNIRITIKSDASVVVTLPCRIGESKAEFFVQQKKDWIEKSVEKMMKRIKDSPSPLLPKGNKKDFEKYKDEALLLVNKRLHYFNKQYGYSWRDVRIKNVSSRWGSCSKSGDLTFSYKIALLPSSLADYIVVHELCHLGEFNHRGGFWK